ncbi:hypothetical protein K1719_039936 [Acacia pycnantha]|nr:hypothetical protein K1719_039936 [Acacia pycnantha]
MDGDNSGSESDNYDWNTEDELEIENFHSSSSNLIVPNGEANSGSGDASSSPGSSNSKMFDHFVRMGFPEKLVSKAIRKHDPGEENEDLLLETIFKLSALDSSPQNDKEIESDFRSSDVEGSSFDDDSDIDSFSDEEIPPVSENKVKLKKLVKMGYEVQEASVAMERCGVDASLAELIDFLCAAQTAKAADALMAPEEKPRCSDQSNKNKRRYYECEVLGRKKPRDIEKKTFNEDDEKVHLPKPMIGFGIPTDESFSITRRTLPEAALGPPYFYYENVALAPKGVWQTISRFLYDIEPEFVDSKYFCAAARKRGYIHNLPIQNRYPLLPLPPHTVHEAIPLTKKWWPSWDHRTQLNCLQTAYASAKLTERIRKAIENYEGTPPEEVRNYVLDECKKWNLVWVGRNKVAPLEPDEVEMLLGFPRNHTRGGGISRTDRYKSLGNSFQVDTVAYHLSVLKDLYPNGINLLSLFSGIGGAEVALYRLGIPLKNVVSVEKSELLDGARLEYYMELFGGFDLVVGGSPCNNLAGSNRVSRDGLEGKESALFYDYFRILDLVKNIMAKGH